MDQVGTPAVLEVLEALWERKSKTASRLRGRVERILDWAKVQGYRTAENPARWRGHLRALLPAPSKVRRPQHHAALDWRQIPDFVQELRKRDGVGARALEFAILTAARSAEVRGMTWHELDRDVWVVPAFRIKGCREHRVPLTSRAFSIVGEMRRFSSSELVFSGERRSRPLPAVRDRRPLPRPHADDDVVVLAANGWIAVGDRSQPLG
jgi:integrase